MAKYIKGVERILKRWDGTAYKPVVCLTNTDFSQALSMIERSNVCTGGDVEITRHNFKKRFFFGSCC